MKKRRLRRSIILAGHQIPTHCDSRQKRWRNLNVDASIKESWLERLNAIQGIRVISTCSGHPPHRTAEFPDRLNLNTNPQIVYDPLHDNPLMTLFSVFGDDALYVQDDWLAPSEMDLIPGIGGRSAIIQWHPASGFTDWVLRVPDLMLITAPVRCQNMTQEEFDWWWETVIGRLESLPSA